MEGVDSEREKEWLDRMDTILTFVCLALFDFDRIDQMCRRHYLPAS